MMWMITKITILLFTFCTVSAFDQYVSLRDVTRETGLPEEITIEVIGNNMKKTILHLKENKRLNENADIYVQDLRRSKFRRFETKSQQIEDIKYYHDKHNRAAVSVTCEKAYYGACKRTVEGFFTIGEDTYEIRPATSTLATRLLKTSDLNLHEVTRVVLFDRNHLDRKASKNRMPLKDYIEIKKAKKIPSRIDTTFKRKSQTEYAVEIVVVTDPYLWKRIYAKTEASNGKSKEDATRYRIRRYLSHVINGVSLMYESIEDPELNIYVTLSGIHIYQIDNEDTPVPKGSDKPKEGEKGECIVDPDIYLDSSYNWLGNKPLKNADHVIFITGCQLTGGIEGVSPLNGACGEQKLSVLGFARYYRLGTTAAHELAHNLGAEHDGEYNKCKKEDMYLMAPATNQLYHEEPHTANPWKFSHCSIAYFKKFLQSEDAWCITEKGSIFDKEEWNKHNKKLPGELYSLDKQCKLMKGDYSGICPVSSGGISESDEKICQEMKCIDQTEDCTPHTVARGSPCGKPEENKWCIYGKCVSRQTGHAEDRPAKVENIDCLTTGDKYGGDVSVTKSGKTCLYWEDVLYEYEDYNDFFKFIDNSAEDALNYCRSPDGAKIPWCFVDDSFEECNIQEC